MRERNKHLSTVPSIMHCTSASLFDTQKRNSFKLPALMNWLEKQRLRASIKKEDVEQNCLRTMKMKMKNHREATEGLHIRTLHLQNGVLESYRALP